MPLATTIIAMTIFNEASRCDVSLKIQGKMMTTAIGASEAITPVTV